MFPLLADKHLYTTLTQLLVYVLIFFSARTALSLFIDLSMVGYLSYKVNKILLYKVYIENYFAFKGIKLMFFSSVFKVRVCIVSISMNQNQSYHTIERYQTIVFATQSVNNLHYDLTM